MGKIRYLIDTNAVIDYLGNRLPPSGMAFMNQVIDNVPAISIITKIELLSFNAAAEHYQILLDFVNESQVFDLSEEIVSSCIDIRKAFKTKLPDAIIAATAIENKLELITRNGADFKNIQTVLVINPYEL